MSNTDCLGVFKFFVSRDLLNSEYVFLFFTKSHPKPFLIVYLGSDVKSTEFFDFLKIYLEYSTSEYDILNFHAS